ncbi:hypothetical protein ABTD73_19320 [Acinetobacter baumannii]
MTSSRDARSSLNEMSGAGWRDVIRRVIKRKISDDQPVNQQGPDDQHRPLQ